MVRHGGEWVRALVYRVMVTMLRGEIQHQREDQRDQFHTTEYFSFLPNSPVGISTEVCVVCSLKELLKLCFTENYASLQKQFEALILHFWFSNQWSFN